MSLAFQGHVKAHPLCAANKQQQKEYNIIPRTTEPAKTAPPVHHVMCLPEGGQSKAEWVKSSTSCTITSHLKARTIVRWHSAKAEENVKYYRFTTRSHIKALEGKVSWSD